MLPLGDATLASATVVPDGTGVSVGGGGGGVVGGGVALGVGVGDAECVGFGFAVVCRATGFACAPPSKSAQPDSATASATSIPAAAAVRTRLFVRYMVPLAERYQIPAGRISSIRVRFPRAPGRWHPLASTE